MSQSAWEKSRRAKILVINPNSNTLITKSFEPIFSRLGSANVSITYWTCPDGPSMIRNQADMYESARYCLPLLTKVADDYDGFLAACYADRPLVSLLQDGVGDKPVVGIFEASIIAALQLVGPGMKFGIVTTGVAYEALLSQSVKLLLRSNEPLLGDFGGVTASGMSLNDLQPESHSIAENKVIVAAQELVRANEGDLDVVLMGGVILAGMEPWVHKACELELGEKGKTIKVVDQLVAGMLMLVALLNSRDVLINTKHFQLGRSDMSSFHPFQTSQVTRFMMEIFQQRRKTKPRVVAAQHNPPERLWRPLT